MITSVVFSNFKALENYSVSIKEFNILVGSNNNGKSTILDAFRALQGAYRHAQAYKPSLMTLANGEKALGYEIPEEGIAISTENVQSNFSSQPAIIKFKFREHHSLILEFAPNSKAKFYCESDSKVPRSTGEFKKQYPLELAVIPTLGPFESSENIVGTDYLKRWHGSKRAPRLFRNYWFQIPSHFDEFNAIVEKTWPGMSVQRPTQKYPSTELTMFYQESRMPREVCWAGFGFQIWLQLLTHIIAAKNADLLIVDEPEIYLHPDLQHKILDILKATQANVILATHSIEIINNAEPHEVLLVDKKNKSARRLSALHDLQTVASVLGSGQNIQLTRLARGKRILFVEGQDAKILGKISKIIGFPDLFSSGIITVIPIDGFNHHTRITNTSWAFAKVLGEEIKLAALLDRDYRAEAEVQKTFSALEKEISLAHILHRKEIENYLLVPTAIGKAILERIKDRQIILDGEFDVLTLLYEVTEYFKDDVNAQLMANKLKVVSKFRQDDATIIGEYIRDFERNWTDIDYRFCVIPGKSVFSKINEVIQLKYKVSITYIQVINCMKKSDIGSDLLDFLERLNHFSIS
jgi:predicted ATPase